MHASVVALVRRFTPSPVRRLARRILCAPAVSRRFGPYQGVETRHNASPLHRGRFAEIYDRFRALDPGQPDVRYRVYNLCQFARLCAGIDGDFITAGVSYGVAPRIIYEFVGFGALAKRMHLIDTFAGTHAGRPQPKYNTDPERVRRSFPAGAPIVIVRAAIPQAFPLAGNPRIAFAHFNADAPEAEADSLGFVYSRLSPGGVIVLDNYAVEAGNFAAYDPALHRLGVEPLWLPSGQGVIIKAR